MRLAILIVSIGAMATALIMSCSGNIRDSEQITEKQFIVKPIGFVHKEKGRTTLELNQELSPSTVGLEGFSHVWVLWWFDRNDTPKKRSILQVHPRGNPKNPLTGVFACRSPVRPNPIALTLCRIRSVKNNIIEIDKIDAFANTPILDLKPYIPGYDSAHASIADWLKNRKEVMNENSGR
jgi:tRNA-Thr(GGU) m(6)t(6)A37 methyltransferase TsaA